MSQSLIADLKPIGTIAQATYKRDSAALMLLSYLSSDCLVRFEGTLNTELSVSCTCREEGGMLRHGW